MVLKHRDNFTFLSHHSSWQNRRHTENLELFTPPDLRAAQQAQSSVYQCLLTAGPQAAAGLRLITGRKLQLQPYYIYFTTRGNILRVILVIKQSELEQVSH